jgi:hypothetical protein
LASTALSARQDQIDCRRRPDRLQLADEARLQAAQMTDSASKRMMMKIADASRRLAKLARDEGVDEKPRRRHRE